MEKKEDNHFIDYLDTTLSVQENKILKNIENIVKTEFSLLESIEKGDFGVFIEDNHVVGLALNQNDLNNTIEAIITLLKNLPKLSVLKLNECNLHSIPKEIENLKSLQKLILMNNNLDS